MTVPVCRYLPVLFSGLKHSRIFVPVCRYLPVLFSGLKHVPVSAGITLGQKHGGQVQKVPVCRYLPVLLWVINVRGFKLVRTNNVQIEYRISRNQYRQIPAYRHLARWSE
jgi:hypothetical protein